MQRTIIPTAFTKGGRRFVLSHQIEGTPPPQPRLHQLAPNHYLWTCPRCNWTLETDTDEPIEHVCGDPNVVRLGDKIEATLTGLGITKEKYRGWKEMLKLPPTCNCEGRQEWLNKLDEKIGLGEKVTKFKAIMGW